MMDAIKEEIAGFLFNVEVTVEESEVQAKGIEANPVSPIGLQYSTADENGNATKNDVSRNATCPCGSGKKYKRCHGGA
jgi:preprotein translocase subunit SecA